VILYFDIDRNFSVRSVSAFYGIIIRIYFNDHEPAHFHGQYAEYQATLDIALMKIFSGELPRRAQELVLYWA
jgi:hypothetical protein